jgi:hypothetical protein
VAGGKKKKINKVPWSCKQVSQSFQALSRDTSPFETHAPFNGNYECEQQSGGHELTS